MSACLSIAELADLICASTAQQKVIGIMRGYFDDTGTHKGSPIVAAAGLVGNVAEWTSLEIRWRSRLAKYELIDFNAAKCTEGEPPYHRLKGMERDSLVLELTHLLSDHYLIPISFAVHLEPWEALKTRDLSKGRAFFERYPRPFLLCFDQCVQAAANWVKTEAGGEPISLVFDEQKSDAIEAAEIFDAYKASKRWGAALHTLTFAPSRGSPPLQAVDLLANETFNYWLDFATDPNIPLRPALPIMWKRFDSELPCFFGMTGLVKAMRKFAP